MPLMPLQADTRAWMLALTSCLLHVVAILREVVGE